MSVKILFMLKGGAANAPGLSPTPITGKDGVTRIHWTKPHEGSKTAHNDAQFSLFGEDGTPYPHLETRPGTTDKQRRLGGDAYTALARRVNLLRDSGGSAATLLGSRLCKEFVASGSNQLVGQYINSPGDLAALAQVYRDPRFETFRAVFVKDGEVVGESAYSSRLPGQVQLPTTISAEIVADQKRYGADGYYLLHNHPGGRAIASSADANLTARIFSEAPGMISHVIVDHVEYGIVHPDGHGELCAEPSLSGPDYHNSPSLDHPLLGVKISGPKDLAIAAKALQAANELGNPVLIMTKGSFSEVELIASAPMALIKKVGDNTARASAWLRGIGRASGAGCHSFLVVSDKDFDLNNQNSPHRKLIRDGMVTDVVSASGVSLRDHGVNPGYGLKPLFDTRREGMKAAEPEGVYAEENHHYLATTVISRLSGGEIGEGFDKEPVDMHQLRKAVRKWAKTGFVGSFTNKRSGLKLEVRASGVEQAIQHGGAADKLRAFAAMPDVLRNGVVVFDGINPKTDRNRLVVIAGKIAINSAEFFVSAGFREDVSGRLFYDHELMDIGKAERLSSQWSESLSSNHPLPSAHLNDYTARYLSQDHFGDTPMQTEFNKALGDKRILFFKSQISAYTTKHGVFVPAHTDKRTKRSLQSGKDDHTLDLFAPNVPPTPKRDIPVEALKKQEDFTKEFLSISAYSKIHV